MATDQVVTPFYIAGTKQGAQLMPVLSIEEADALIASFQVLTFESIDFEEVWEGFCYSLQPFGIVNALYGFAPFREAKPIGMRMVQKNNYCKHFNDWYFAEEMPPVDVDYLVQKGLAGQDELIWSMDEDFAQMSKQQLDNEKRCQQEFGLKHGISFYPRPRSPGSFCGIGLSATGMSEKEWARTQNAHKSHLKDLCDNLFRSMQGPMHKDLCCLTDDELMILKLKANGWARGQLEGYFGVSKSAIQKRLVHLAHKMQIPFSDEHILSAAYRLTLVK